MEKVLLILILIFLALPSVVHAVPNGGDCEMGKAGQCGPSDECIQGKCQQALSPGF